MSSPNPYDPPKDSPPMVDGRFDPYVASGESELAAQPRNSLGVLALKVIWFICSLATCSFLGLVVWILSLLAILLVFGDTNEYWPGWAAAVPAVLIGGGLFYLIYFRLVAYLTRRPNYSVIHPPQSDL